jgi:hypothetical protein
MTVLAPEVAGPHTIGSGVSYAGKYLGRTGVPDRSLVVGGGGSLSVCQVRKKLGEILYVYVRVTLALYEYFNFYEYSEC